MHPSLKRMRKVAMAYNKRTTRRRPGLAQVINRCLGLLLPLACPIPAFADAGAVPAPAPIDGRASPDLAVRPLDDPFAGSSRWTASLEAIAFTRSNSVSRVLVSRLPGATTFGQTQALVGTEAFNSSQFDQGYAVGPRFTVQYRAEANRRFDLSYLAVLDLKAESTIGPEDPANWYVMRAPGFWQTQDFYYQGMAWASKSDLHSLEANARFEFTRDLEILAGFRWLRLKDSLTGSLTPADTNEPSWKIGGCAAVDNLPPIESAGATTLPGTARPCAAGGVVGGYPAFWTTGTTNDLLGLQAGVEGTFLTIGPLSVRGVAKAGVYDNRAQQDAAVSMQKQMYYANAKTDRLAFAGQGGVQARYTISRNLSATLGYELLWLDRVALAPGQIDLTASVSSPGSVTATGVDTGASILLQGFTAGFQYTF